MSLRWFCAHSYTIAVSLSLVLALFGSLPAHALGRCDVAPLDGPDGKVEIADALVILRIAVGLVDPASVELARADVAPLEELADDYVRAVGDGEIRASDALICLRVAVELIALPPNLRVEIQSVSPVRPPAQGTGTARVRIENDGDSDAPADTTVSLSLGEGAAAAAAEALEGDTVVASLGEPLEPGAERLLDLEFTVGSGPGPRDLQVIAETSVPQASDEPKTDLLEIEINGPPVADAGEDFLEVLEQNPVTLGGSASDPNDDAVTYSWTQIEGPGVVDPTGLGTATPTLTLPDIWVETEVVFSLVVTEVSAETLQSQPDTVTIPIRPLNNPPVAVIDSVVPDTPEGTIVTLKGTVSDPNADPIITIEWVQLEGPNGLLEVDPAADPHSPVAYFTIPDVTEDQSFGFELRATDNEAAVGTASVAFVGELVNEDPIAAVSAPERALEGTIVALDGTGSEDPDGHSVEFSWSQTSGPSVALEGANQATASFLAPQTGDELVLGFALRVTDGHDGEGTAPVAVTVEPDPLFPVDVIVRATPGSAVKGSEPAVTVEVEVLARDRSRLVRDGTPIGLSTSLGTLGSDPVVFGSTRLGLFTTTFTPGPVPGLALVQADVLASSAESQLTIGVHEGPDEVGQLRLSLDPPVILAGSGTPVWAVATALAADERTGSVADETVLDFSSSAGSFPSGSSAPTANGVAAVEFSPPASPGSLDLEVASGDVMATATLSVIEDSGAATPRFEADRLTFVSGGPGMVLTAYLDPLLPGAQLPASQLEFDTETPEAQLDGLSFVSVDSQPLVADRDVPPFGDFPGPGDEDWDADQTLSSGGRFAQVSFTHATVEEPVEVEVIAATGEASDALRITVVPDAAAPGLIDLEASPMSMVAAESSADLSAVVDAAGGGSVVDDTPVEFSSSAGEVDPPESLTVDGEAQARASHADGFPLPARVRARSSSGAIAALTDLSLVPNANDPGALQLLLEPSPVEDDGMSEALVSAHVTRPDGTGGTGPAEDGTRVLFHSTRGLPSSAVAETTGGIAQIWLLSSDEPGSFDVEARVAGSVVNGSARGSFAPARTETITFGLAPADGVASLMADIQFPDGAAPVLLGETEVQMELITAAEGGIANPGGLAVANQIGGIVRVGIAFLTELSGSGDLFRLSFDLPPGGDLSAEGAIAGSLVTVSNKFGSQLEGITLSCWIGGLDLNCPEIP